MNGLMMGQPLLISSLLKHAERHHRNVEVVSAQPGGIHRETLGELAERARRMANAIAALGTKDGDRVATMAWNSHRHMELYYAASGSGRVLHTVNPRLHPDQIAYVINHAEDQILFFDADLLSVVDAVAAKLTSVRHYVVMTDRAHMPASAVIKDLLCYEDLLAAQSDSYQWPILDENAAASLCYTSGTTGNPKGVLYSHRSSLLHTFAVGLPDGLNIGGNEVVLPIVPMFHVNAWGWPYLACMVGTKMVLPGAALDGKSLYNLIEAEGVTLAGGVPTVWQNLLSYLEAGGLSFSTLKRTVVGGAACPAPMIRKLQDTYGVQVTHAWGMTETSPLGVSCTFKPAHALLSKEERLAIQTKQGRAVFGVDFKIVDESGTELPWDGKATGELYVQGPWVAAQYFRQEDSPLVDGWFPTGDLCSVDSDGYVQITDRNKDVIKSGGEWISSIDVESIALGHPDVSMAACVAAPHPKWGERPLLVVVKKPGSATTRESVLDFFQGKVAKWWIPDDVVFVDAIPLGATGKMQKNKLREQLTGYQLPD